MQGEGEGQGDASIGQRTSKNVGKLPEFKKRGMEKIFPYSPQKEGPY